MLDTLSGPQDNAQASTYNEADSEKRPGICISRVILREIREDISKIVNIPSSNAVPIPVLA